MFPPRAVSLDWLHYTQAIEPNAVLSHATLAISHNRYGCIQDMP